MRRRRRNSRRAASRHTSGGRVLRIDERRVDDVFLLDLRGKITAGDGDVLIRDTIQQLVARGARKIVLNFVEVPYMDSVGLSTIIRSYLTLERDGGRLRLLNVPKHLAELLTVTRLTAVFDTFNDET